MSIPSQESQATIEIPAKELNFRKLEEKYNHEISQERFKREELERKVEELSRKQTSIPDEEDDYDSLVDHRKLDKKLAKAGQQFKQETQTEIQKAVRQAISEERKQNWIKSNPDFQEVLQHAEAFAMKNPDLAESILEMPEGFERQKLVYKNIKATGAHLPPQKESSIQDKIDQNRKSPYYQPSGVGSAPYSNSGDFSQGGQKQAYDKMKELQKRLRLG